MEYTFHITSISSELITKTIHIVFSLDVDEETINGDNIYLMSKSPRAIVPCSFNVDGRNVDMILDNSPSVNTEYNLVVEPNCVLSITEDKLGSLIPYTIIFKSQILDKIQIMSPANYEEADKDMKITWKDEDASPLGTYRLQIATDNMFNNIVFNEFTDHTNEMPKDSIFEMTPGKDFSPGQYFFRVRAESKTDFGQWSPVQTFVIPTEKTVVPNPQPEEKPRPDLPEIKDYTEVEQNKSDKTDTAMSIVSTPERTNIDNEVPTSFHVDFTKAVKLDNISVTIKKKVI